MYLSAHLVVFSLTSPSTSLPPPTPRRRILNTTLNMPPANPIIPAFMELPPDIESIRQRLFDLSDAELKFTTAEHDRYWPFVSNIWVRNKTNRAQ